MNIIDGVFLNGVLKHLFQKTSSSSSVWLISKFESLVWLIDKLELIKISSRLVLVKKSLNYSSLEESNGSKKSKLSTLRINLHGFNYSNVALLDGSFSNSIDNISWSSSEIILP